VWAPVQLHGMVQDAEGHGRRVAALPACNLAQHHGGACSGSCGLHHISVCSIYLQLARPSSAAYAQFVRLLLRS
jgi:hypothetical protein